MVYPISLYPDLDRLKAAVATAKQQRNISTNKKPEEQGFVVFKCPGIQSAMENLMNKIPSFARMQEIQKRQKALDEKSGGGINREEVEKLREEQRKIMEEMSKAPRNQKLIAGD